MSNDGEEIRFRGVRKRKWGKYVAEIRSGNRSRISLGSYSTPEAAARAYDAALLCLRGPNATQFNFPESSFNSTVMEVATAHGTPSSDVIRTIAIAVASGFDPIPLGNGEEAGPSTAGSAIIKEAAPIEASIQPKEVIEDEAHQVREEEENEVTYLLQAPEDKPFEEIIQMAPLKTDSQVSMRSYDQSELFPNLPSWDTKQ